MEFYFSFGLLALTLVTGIIWCLDAFVLSKRRLNTTITSVQKDKNLPWMAEFSKSMFPVFFIVLIIRSFIIEPYRIPSPSMLPTLQIGDFIMVNKFSYGLKLPLWDRTWFKIGRPKRGDIVVFHYPVDPNRYYIKRVVGVPGDTIAYENKQLVINGEPMIQKLNNQWVQTEEASNELFREYEETLGDVRHEILHASAQKALDFVKLKIPEGNYFVMGDNRDNSADSRYWGFVPEEMVIGTPFLIFFSVDFEAKDVRWSRIGKLVS